MKNVRVRGQKPEVRGQHSRARKRRKGRSNFLKFVAGGIMEELNITGS
jgi:hypothetical protein